MNPYTTDTDSTGTMSADELLDLIRRPEWWGRAACRGAGNRAFFPHKGEDNAEALSYCNRCPVTEECLAWSMSGGSWVPGVWGGKSERQRRELIRLYRTCRICGERITKVRRVSICGEDCEREAKRRSQYASNQRRAVAE